MVWKPEIEEIERRKQIAFALGGAENVRKQHSYGKYSVRERIETFLDEGTFSETGLMAGEAIYDGNQLVDVIPCPIVMGLGKVGGRKIAIQGDDFTIKGASVGRMYKAKLAYITKMALELRVPMVRHLEGAGGSIKEIEKMGYIEFPTITDYAMRHLAELMSVVPVVSVALGPVSGIGAMLMVESHFSVMVKEQSQVFVGGPPVVQAAMGQKVTKEELGGYKIHTRLNGVVDNEAENEADAFEQTRQFLDYMPPNVWEMPKRKNIERDAPMRREEELLTLIPRDYKIPYDMRKILNMVFDKDSIFEIGKYQGRSQITVLARLNGYPVGVLANDPKFKAGAFDWDVAEKYQRFIDMCDTFHIPIVNFVDQPGFMVGRKSEEYGTIRKGVRASFSVVQATIPWATIIVRRCFGVAGAAQSDTSRLNWRYIWPSAYWGNIPIEGGVYAAYRAEIESAEDPMALHDKLQKKYRDFVSPFRAAEHFNVENIIDPRDTRRLLCDWVEMVYPIEITRLGIKTRRIRC